MSFAEEPAILVCCAVREEAAFLRPDKRLDVLVTGMGRDNAEKQVHQRLKSSDYDLILTCGFAGGLNPYLASGTVVFDCDADESLTVEAVEQVASATTLPLTSDPPIYIQTSNPAPGIPCHTKRQRKIVFAEDFPALG